MISSLNTFKKTFSWYRNLSLKLLREIPDKYLNEQLSPKSLSLCFQFIDLGEMELRVLERTTGEKITHLIHEPSKKNASKKEIISYINQCHQLFLKEVKKLEGNGNSYCNWYGRMKFDLSETLTFLLAHEAMHHGEILAFIQAKKVPMPKAFKQTWGFE